MTSVRAAQSESNYFSGLGAFMRRVPELINLPPPTFEAEAQRERESGPSTSIRRAAGGHAATFPLNYIAYIRD